MFIETCALSPASVKSGHSGFSQRLGEASRQYGRELILWRLVDPVQALDGREARKVVRPLRGEEEPAVTYLVETIERSPALRLLVVLSR